MTKIKKVLTTGLIGATLAIGLTGCGEPIPPKQMNIKKIDNINVEYKFIDNINSTPISEQRIKTALISHLASNSKYINKTINHRIATEPTYGKVINYNNNVITINYLNGNQNCGRDCKSIHGQVTQAIFKINTKIESKSKNTFLLSATFPKQYTIKPDSSVFGSEFKPLDKPNKLEADAKKMFNSLKLKPLLIKRSIKFKGEINTKYQDKAIYANFKRILGEFINWRYWNRTNNEIITESKKQNSFDLKINNKSYPLDVEVYPYRDGSKVIYSTTLKYTVDSNGNSTLTKKDIDALHNKIAKIINN